jgi:hypothetical protein
LGNGTYVNGVYQDPGDLGTNTSIGIDGVNIGNNAVQNAESVTGSTEVSVNGIYAAVTELAYILSKYDTGITLMQADANGNYHPVYYTKSTDANGKVQYNSSPCPN